MTIETLYVAFSLTLKESIMKLVIDNRNKEDENTKLCDFSWNSAETNKLEMEGF